jgi:hypothetical protein
MTRRKWVQIKGELVEVDPATYVPTERGSGGVRYVSDAWMDGTRSPIDGADIGSRTKLREHMRAHGVIDHAEATQEAAIQRRRFSQEYERSVVRDVVEAAQRVSSGFKPNLQEHRDD